MDLTNLTLAGLVAVGAVNVIGFFKPDLKSEYKFGLAFIVAFIVTFIPVELGNEILNKAKFALEVAFASSGAYKLLTKAGGN